MDKASTDGAVPPTSVQGIAEPSTRQLILDLRTELGTLVRDEMALAREEMAGKTRKAVLGGVLLGVGGLSGFYGGGCVIAAIIVALQTASHGWQAPLLVGVVLLLVAGAFALSGIKVLRSMGSAIPERTVERLQKDLDAVTQGLRR